MLNGCLRALVTACLCHVERFYHQCLVWIWLNPSKAVNWVHIRGEGRKAAQSTSRLKLAKKPSRILWVTRSRMCGPDAKTLGDLPGKQRAIYSVTVSKCERCPGVANDSPLQLSPGTDPHHAIAHYLLRTDLVSSIRLESWKSLGKDKLTRHRAGVHRRVLAHDLVGA